MLWQMCAHAGHVSSRTRVFPLVKHVWSWWAFSSSSQTNSYIDVGTKEILEMWIIADTARNSCTSLVCALGDRGLCCFKILDGKITNEVIWQVQGMFGSILYWTPNMFVETASCLSMTVRTAALMRFPSEVNIRGYCWREGTVGSASYGNSCGVAVPGLLSSWGTEGTWFVWVQHGHLYLTRVTCTAHN